MKGFPLHLHPLVCMLASMSYLVGHVGEHIHVLVPFLEILQQLQVLPCTHTHTLCHCSLEEDRDQVEREHSRLPKKEELEQLIKQLTRDTEQLKDEIQLVS